MVSRAICEKVGERGQCEALRQDRANAHLCPEAIGVLDTSSMIFNIRLVVDVGLGTFLLPRGNVVRYSVTILGHL
jgi:hypothetical protein